MCGEQERAAVEQVEHDLGRRIARGGIQAGKGLVKNHRAARAQQGAGDLDATALPARKLGHASMHIDPRH